MSTEYICGVNAVLEAIRSRKRRVHEVYISLGKKKSTLGRIIDESKKNGVSVQEVDRERIRELTRIEKNQGVAARVDQFGYEPIENIIEKAKSEGEGSFIVVLDEILDPQNVGSLIRTAHLSGASGLIIPKDRSAPIGPAATRAAAGATEYLPISQVTNISNTLKRLKDKGFWVVGADGESDDVLYTYDFTNSHHVIVMGGEGKGIRRLVKEMCDSLLSIPMEGRVGSYNVSVAGAIFMSEISRQRWAKTHAKVIPFGPKRA